MDPNEAHYSPPLSSPRRAHLQFPPPPPYPPPGSENLLPPNHHFNHPYYEEEENQRAFYADQSGNIVLMEEFGMNNLAMCLDDEQLFMNRNSSPFLTPDHFPDKIADKVLFKDHTMNKSVLDQSHYPSDPPCNTSSMEHFLNNNGLGEALNYPLEHLFNNHASPEPEEHHLNNSQGCSQQRRFITIPEQFIINEERFNNSSKHSSEPKINFQNCKKPNNLLKCRVRLMQPTKPEHFNAKCLEDFEPDAYSYAYYEPGPTAAPSNNSDYPPDYHHNRETRHTYTTRYGTEENIYEEISEVAALASKLGKREHKQSQLSLNQSVYEEEVLTVESRHRRVLGELNLTVEAMLMPQPRDDSNNATRPDILEDLLKVGPTDDLLSPPEDSGFCGSSLSSYHSFRRPLAAKAPPCETRSLSRGRGYQRLNKSQEIVLKPRFWSKKGWKCLPKRGTASGKDEPHAGVETWDELANQEPASIFHRGISSEESWYSGSDREMSSGDDETEKSSVTNIKSNGQLKSTLNKARHLCDKLRPLSREVSNSNAHSTIPALNEGRLSRWFSIRRGITHQYDIDSTERTTGVGNMPLLVEVEEENCSFNCVLPRRQVPPSLPAPPADLTPLQIKRRHIVAAIVHSENSYVATLQRLVNDYKKPLEESNPLILSSSKISTLFHRLPEILQCHTLFRIALAENVRSWDKEERLGDVFVASFSKAVVLDVYSGFINNFSAAMDLAKMEAKRKSALADFLKVKQISAHDRLSFFGLMVKPVQRFPQFILFLQDLLKHTPQGHHDRMSLQLALTQLESLAELLNERKREAEQFQAFKETLRHLSGKFTARPLSDVNRCLLREDNVTQLEFNQSGLITKSKRRRLLLLNDLVVCVAVSSRQTEDYATSERLSLKWTVPVMDIEVIDTSGSPTLSRLLTAGLSRNGSVKSTDGVAWNGDNLCMEMNHLMQDYEVVSRIADLVASLNGTYEDLSVDSTKGILTSIQASIQHKDEEMAWVDSCCLQVVVRGTKSKDDVRYTFQTDNPNVKKEWITELRLAQLALDVTNSPAWEIPEQERRPSTKMPLFVRAQSVFKSEHQSTEVNCGCFYLVPTLLPSHVPNTRRRHPPTSYLWLCTLDGISTHVSVLTQTGQGHLKDVTSYDLEANVTTIEYVKGLNSVDTVWLGTSTSRLFLQSAFEPEKQEQIGQVEVPAAITQIRYHCDSVFVALTNGILLDYHRFQDGTWDLKDPHTLVLGSDPVSCLLPINAGLYASCGKKVWVLNGLTGEIQKSFSIQHEHVGNVNLMAHSGVGLWISLENSSTICLYHTETFKHLQDINIASNVLRVVTNPDCEDCTVNVTALLACKGLLWVGTNVGVSLTIPLPRLEGVPIISGRVNISYHAHFGPITFLLALQPRNYHQYKEAIVEEKPEAKEDAIKDGLVTESVAAKLKQHLMGSPVVLRRKKSKENAPMLRRTSKTLPRGLGAGVLSASFTSSQGSGDCDVYGLYGELMYVKDYDGEDPVIDPVYESLRRSDPEIAAIPNKVSTLDRRLKLKASRPRSLDLSNWSVDSHTSSLYTTSSEETSRNGSASVSRTGSSASTVPVLNCASETKVKSAAKSAAKKCPVVDGRRTVITLMGGKGYVNWRNSCCSGDSKLRNPGSEPNMSDAHIVVWETKL